MFCICRQPCMLLRCLSFGAFCVLVPSHPAHIPLLLHIFTVYKSTFFWPIGTKNLTLWICTFCIQHMCALLQEVLSLQMMLAISPSFVGGGFLLAPPPVKELLPGDSSWRRENCSFETRVFLAPVDDPVPVRICTIVMGLSGFSIKIGREGNALGRRSRWGKTRGGRSHISCILPACSSQLQKNLFKRSLGNLKCIIIGKRKETNKV